MVVFKSDAKRRSKNVHPTAEALSKRAKVHAQRKFAQGVGVSGQIGGRLKEKLNAKAGRSKSPSPCGSSSLSTRAPCGATSSQSTQPSHRPKTEDFLTFLCFRGTPVLPARLDFFNNASSSEPVSSASQQPLREDRQKMQKKKIINHSAVKIHPNRFDTKHKLKLPVVSLAAAREVRGGRELRKRKLLATRLRRRATQRVLPCHRPINCILHSRLVEGRRRAGLRSGGGLSQYTDTTHATTRHPPHTITSPSSPITYPVRKSAPPVQDSGCSDSETECMSIRTTTRSTSSRRSHNPSPSSPSVKKMPSRKTKEAATVYLEMISKRLGSPEEEDSVTSDHSADRTGALKSRRFNQVARHISSNVNKAGKRVGSRINLRERALKRVKKSTGIRNLRVPRLPRSGLRSARTRPNLEDKDSSSVVEDEEETEDDDEVKVDPIKETEKVKDKLIYKSKSGRDKKDVETKVRFGLRSRQSNSNELQSTSTSRVLRSQLDKKPVRKQVEGGKSKSPPAAKQGVKSSIKETKDGTLKFQTVRGQDRKKSIAADEISGDESTGGQNREHFSEIKKRSVQKESIDVSSKKSTRESRITREPLDDTPKKLIQSVGKSSKGNPDNKEPELKDKPKKTGKDSNKASDDEPLKELSIASKRKSRKEPAATKHETQSDEGQISSKQVLGKKRTAKTGSPWGNAGSIVRENPRRNLKSSVNEVEEVANKKPIKEKKSAIKNNGDSSGRTKPPAKACSSQKIKTDKKADEVNKVNEEKNVKFETKEQVSKIKDEKDSNCKKVEKTKSGVTKYFGKGKYLKVRKNKKSNLNETSSSGARNEPVQVEMRRTRLSAAKSVGEEVVKDLTGISESEKIELRRESVSSLISGETTLSECKVVIENLDNSILIKDEVVETVASNRIPEKAAKKSIQAERSKGSTLSLPTNRGLRVRKAAPPNKITRPQVPPAQSMARRPTRARTVKHSGSSFYYETDSSSHFSSSEEELVADSSLLKKKLNKPASVPNSKEENIEIVTNEKKLVPKSEIQITDNNSEPGCTVSDANRNSSSPQTVSHIQSNKNETEAVSVSASVNEKDCSEDIPEDLKDIKLDQQALIVSPDILCDETLNPINLIADAAAGILGRGISPKSRNSDSDKSDKKPSSSANEKTNFIINETPINKGSESVKIPVVDSSLPTGAGSISKHIPSKASCIPVKQKQEDTTPKPKSSIGETWINAFKNAKIPKPGQLSPITQSVKPFVRKPFTSQPFVSKPSPKKCDLPDKKFKDLEHLSSTSMRKVSLPPYQTSTLVKPLNKEISDKKPTKSIECSTVIDSKIIPNQIPKADISKSTETERIQVKQTDGRGIESRWFEKRDVSPSSKLFHKCISESKREVETEKKSSEGKHQNLPLAVEHTLRKMSPVAVSRKPVSTAKLPMQPLDSKDTVLSDSPKMISNKSSPSSGSRSSWLWKPEKYLSDALVTKSSDLELMSKKKVNMTVEEINKWLNESTSSGVDLSKDCVFLEKNICDPGFQNASNQGDDCKVGRSIVEPPVQLKDLDIKCTAETISACKVEDYKEKIISKAKPEKCDIKREPIIAMLKPKQPLPLRERAWKRTRSMTEEEMCDFGFRFERNSSSPRDSGSDISSPNARDETLPSDEISDKAERRLIFQKRSKRPLSKSPCAFNAENESSVYAFEPDLPPVKRPFRRSGSKSKGSEEESLEGASNSIAVQVNLEPEKVLECSTQTDHEEEDGGSTFYIPLRRQEAIQGVTVKLDADSDGQEQRVIMRAKIVTKSSSPSFSRPPPPQTRSSGQGKKPEQKVRPLVSRKQTPPVGTVQPTVREVDVCSATTSQGTQSLSSTDNKATSPLWNSGNKEGFPSRGSSPAIVEAPTFYPTEEEFLDPLEYIDKITPLAENFGICRIVPPASFKPECKVSDDMRFTAYNQYVHKMMRRWGPNVKEMTAIKKYLATQSIALNQPPWVGGMEVDLPRLYQTVQQLGGLKEVIEKKKWARVADAMKIPKCAQDRVTKLDDIYCKYLLPYDTLSPGERNRLLDEVEGEWRDRERRAAIAAAQDSSTSASGPDDEDDDDDEDEDSQDNVIDECVTKGKSMALSGFYRIARNTMWMWFGEGGNPGSEDVEAEYWRQVETATSHLCVNSGSIETGTLGYGFPTTKTSSTSRHPWNLKVLSNNAASVLRSIGPLMGVTVPTLHVGMLFSTFCWYRDPHGLPWIEYLHTGANKIWYGVPDEWSSELRSGLKSVLPRVVRDSAVWLPSDTAMVPPNTLLHQGVSLCRTVQQPGHFVLIFPKAYTSAFCTGYLLSESVYFAQISWLQSARQIFKDTRESCEPTMFSFEQLLFSIANDNRSSLEVLLKVAGMVAEVREKEVRERKELERMGVTRSERLARPSKRPLKADSHPQHECHHCRASLYLSLTVNEDDEATYCLKDGIKFLVKHPDQAKNFKLLYSYDEEELEECIEKIKTRIEIKSQKKGVKSCCV